MIDENKLENIIETILEHIEVEVNYCCYADADIDFETIPYIDDEGRLIVKKLIREILECK